MTGRLRPWASRLGRYWRTLRPIPPQQHVVRLLQVARKKAWRPLLPTLIGQWRLGGAAQAAALTPNATMALLRLGTVLAQAPKPAWPGLQSQRFVLGGRDVAAFPPPRWHDKDLRPLELYEVTYLQWLDAWVSWLLQQDDRQALQAAAGALADWQTESVSVPAAWEPYPRARRVLACLTCAARLQVAGDPLPAFRLALLAEAAAARSALRWLLEYHLDGNHLLVDRLALAAAALVFGEARGRTNTALAAAKSQCARQFAPDGSHVEGSPMYHALLLEDMLLVDALQPGVLGDVVPMSLGWLAAIVHPDGLVPAFGDTAPTVLSGLSLVPARLQTTAPGQPQPRHSVWCQRTGDSLVVVHTAPDFAPQPGHSHDDHFSVEWSAGGVRRLADVGLAGYEGDPRRPWNRSAAAHSTVSVAGRPGLEAWSAFRVGDRGLVTAWDSGQEAGWPGFAGRFVFPADTAGVLWHDRVVLSQSAALVIFDRLGGPAAAREPPAHTRFLLTAGVWDSPAVYCHRSTAEQSAATTRIVCDRAYLVESSERLPARDRIEVASDLVLSVDGFGTVVGLLAVSGVAEEPRTADLQQARRTAEQILLRLAGAAGLG